MLFKYSGKYVKIYFNMKITFLNVNFSLVFPAESLGQLPKRPRYSGVFHRR